MIVTFISQCEKNALKKSRRVLDAYADRIGDRTWQTLITSEGLNAVKKNLRKTASKNTAVACHWIRSRNRTELVWIVGNREKFNLQGIVPVNYTKRNILNSQWENDWHMLPLIQTLVALASLLHDWGKASKWFQLKLERKSKKVIGDPLRHEWVSCLFICALIDQSGDYESDEAWLTLLETGRIDESAIIRYFEEIEKNASLPKPLSPFDRLSPIACLVVWLILSHHRLPLWLKDNNWKGESAETISDVLKRITQQWSYENRYDEEEFQRNIKSCFIFPKGFPGQSSRWRKQSKRWAAKAIKYSSDIKNLFNDGSFRVVLSHARLCLMLGDHYYSSQDQDPRWQDDSKLFANTDRESGMLKQKLDEHLVKVSEYALKIARLLPFFESQPPCVYDVHSLKMKSKMTAFKWQDKAVENIKVYRQSLPKKDSEFQRPFFVINMASTGCGKTMANAKIMRALSKDGESLRYILALGLRTLTLQTGDEYRERIGLDETELAVLIGSKAIMELHEKNKSDSAEEEMEGFELTGTESLESLLDEEIDYDCDIPEEGLATVLQNQRDRKFLYAPVLACTIDHLMGATETKRGGRFILPQLRLMSSDLVIDEIDDFSGSDLIAIGRLIHLTGMLGRKVMLSSATIPPDLAEGYFNAYRKGWEIFQKRRDAGKSIGCAWIDEFNTVVETVAEVTDSDHQQRYRELHQRFIDKRIRKLGKAQPKRKGKITACSHLYPFHSVAAGHSGTDEISMKDGYFENIKQSLITLHNHHNTVDERTKKQVSFGVVRVANIEPCIDLAQYLLKAEWPENTKPKVMAYHSRQVLFLRNEQEKHLDAVLKRKEGKGSAPKAFSHPVIREHIDGSRADNIIFILVATPVEEVGRDHDFDWAVIEPSSYRSIIQLIGRILRHRDLSPSEANIALMQYNLRALHSGPDSPAYCFPGYESNKHRLKTHDLSALVNPEEIAACIDAIPRISRNQELQPEERLADLEHYAIASLLTAYEKKGPESLEGWLAQNWWMTALPQQENPFRNSDPAINLYLVCEEDELFFAEKLTNGGFKKCEMAVGIHHETETDYSPERLWLKRDYRVLLEDFVESNDGMTLKTASLRYGEINIPDPDRFSYSYRYSDQFGLKKM